MQPIPGSERKQHDFYQANEKFHTVTVVTSDQNAVIHHLNNSNIYGSFWKQGPAIKLRASLATLGNMFGVKAGVTAGGHVTYHGQLHVEDSISKEVIAVLGLDNHKVAVPHFRMTAATTPPHSLRPLQINWITNAYQFPSNKKYSGAGQCVGIIEFGGGYRSSDLSFFYRACKFNPYPDVTDVSVDGANNSPGNDADTEVVLDIEVASCVAPGAKYKVFFADNTDAGFYNAVAAAVTDPEVTVISISWGGPYDLWTGQAINALNQIMADSTKPICIACGDSGSNDGVADGKYHVDFPAASSAPCVFACGGTTLNLGSDNRSILSETVWNETAYGEGATGGGISPTGRNTPDLSGNADPRSGYLIYQNGQWITVGGTSAVAPLIAGLLAQIGSAKGKGSPVGLTMNRLVAAHAISPVFRDVTVGNNSSDPSLPLYPAKVGYDNCTGYGSPIGTAFLRVALAE